MFFSPNTEVKPRFGDGTTGRAQSPSLAWKRDKSIVTAGIAMNAQESFG